MYIYIYMQIDKNASMEFITWFKWMISITILGSKGTSSSPSMLLDSAPPFLLEKRHTQKKRWNYKSLGSHPCEDLKCLEVSKVGNTGMGWSMCSCWRKFQIIPKMVNPLEVGRVTSHGVLPCHLFRGEKKNSETHGVSAVYRGPHHCIYN